MKVYADKHSYKLETPVDITLTGSPVVARTRKLRAKWSEVSPADMHQKRLYKHEKKRIYKLPNDFFVTNEALAGLSECIKEEIDNSILKELTALKKTK